MDNQQQIFLDFLRACEQGLVSQDNESATPTYPVARWLENTLIITHHDPDNITSASIRTMCIGHPTSPDGETIATFRAIALRTSDGKSINIGLPYPIPPDVARSGAFEICVKDSDGKAKRFQMRGDLSCAVTSPTSSAQHISYGRS